MSPPTDAPRVGVASDAGATGDVLLEVKDLVTHFTVGGGLFGGRAGIVRALDGVSFTSRPGETFGPVGGGKRWDGAASGDAARRRPGARSCSWSDRRRVG